MKKILVFLLLVLFVFFSSGCKDHVRLSRKMLVQGIGIEKTENGYSVFAHVAKVSEEEGAKTELFTGNGESVSAALQSMAECTGKTPLYSHTMYIVLGGSCGKSGIGEAIDFFVRYYETRSSLNVYYAPDGAEAIFSSETGTIPDASKIAALAQTAEITGNTVNADIVSVSDGLLGEGKSAFLPVITLEEGNPVLRGTAIFFHGKYSGTLDADETRGFLILSGRIRSANTVITDSEVGEIGLSVKNYQCKTTVKLAEGKPVFYATVSCQADLEEITGGLGKRMGSEYYARFQSELSEKIGTQIKRAVETALKKHHCDIFGFSSLLLRKETSYWRAIKDSWDEKMVSCEIYVTVNAKIARVEEEITPII